MDIVMDNIFSARVGGQAVNLDGSTICSSDLIDAQGQRYDLSNASHEDCQILETSSDYRDTYTLISGFLVELDAISREISSYGSRTKCATHLMTKTHSLLVDILMALYKSVLDQKKTLVCNIDDLAILFARFLVFFQTQQRQADIDAVATQQYCLEFYKVILCLKEVVDHKGEAE